MSDAYWHFYEIHNPPFCPANFTPDTIESFHGSAQTRFKILLGCKRSVTCDECRQLNVDRETDVKRPGLSDKISHVFEVFFNWWVVWFLISSVEVAWTIQPIFITKQITFNFLWYQNPLLFATIPCMILVIIGAWLFLNFVTTIRD
jgi:hypothetical protein